MRRLSRRDFVRIGGLIVVGVGAETLSALAREERGAAPAAQKIRWAMAIDPAKCAQDPTCRDCIEACHKTHNVPVFAPNANGEETNTQHEIKWIWKGTFEEAFNEHEGDVYASGGMKEQPILLLCNHCDNPPCVRVCPTQATWKRESDGIVMMDFHRCIGCRFCISGCPYGSRSFNFRDPRPFVQEINAAFPTRTKGVVEKCNFCEERLAVGQQPACVEACKQKALVFGDVEDLNSAIRQLLQAKLALRRKVHLGTRPQAYYITS